ncbi:1-aminocyclopropane-1-carboxylate deaminase/D-cysteine desulfhydrase [Algoriphagus sp. A40]|uniref:1-aminocyclopropane-1-carboxylate deaminase/D-cysteine desulfhydrase n=1 Tax=Algoriphagus sp. A40 TaxID=1945863 RepID=UPI000986994B|nr:pyridoxal-phosphate dependent enzyme [Algoriphagus sp. A40]OOG76895.1 1-aminocyclopropane-1-carboxylate deaminase [Algoriphagus sp. A40]
MLVQQPIPIQTLSHPILEEKAIQLDVLRLDKVHSEVSGNKFFKLKYNLEEAGKQEKRRILTFGGAFSNHIYATAFAAFSAGLSSIGIIRGEDADLNNPTLRHAKKMGMVLQVVDRESYRNKDSPEFLEKLKAQFGQFYLIPEGGTNEFAIYGTKEILNNSHSEYSHICVSIGTGGTFAGLASSLKSHQTLVGFSSLKGDFIKSEIENLLSKFGIKPEGKLEIQTGFHFGGYGKHKPDLIDFMLWFYKEFKIPLDPIYTGKMVFGVWDLIEKDHFPSGSKILLIHTGGLQGNAGFAEKAGIELPTL